MPCTEAYKEHIMYTFNGFCKTVIRYAALNAWRDRSRQRQKEISLEYLTEEKFYPLGTTDEYFEAPYEEHPITVCGQTVILTNGELAAVLQGELSRTLEATANAEKFMKVVRKYTSFEELTPTLLREFVEKIVIHESEALDGKRRGKLRRQEIEIYYSFVGKVELPDA